VKETGVHHLGEPEEVEEDELLPSSFNSLPFGKKVVVPSPPRKGSVQKSFASLLSFSGGKKTLWGCMGDHRHFRERLREVFIPKGVSWGLFREGHIDGDFRGRERPDGTGKIY